MSIITNYTQEDAYMSTVTIVLLVILVVLVGLLIGLYFFGKKTQKKQEEQQAQIEASKQTVSMLVIDKKRLPLKQSGLPQMVIDQTPKLLRRSKVGPKISILIADEKVFDLIPVKKEIKAEVSGLYIVGVKGIHGTLEAPVKKKKGFFARFKKDKAPEVQSQPKQSGKSAKNTKTAAANTNTTDKKNKKKK